MGGILISTQYFKMRY